MSGFPRKLLIFFFFFFHTLGFFFHISTRRLLKLA
jgi:hypothetical protein